jgi:outer membrane protein, heavy metal efflux system
MSKYNSLLLLLFLTNTNLLFAQTKDAKEVVQILSQYHPEAKVMLSNNNAHKKHTDGSGILPDPKLGFAYRNYPTKYGYALNDSANNTPGMTGMELSISQEFPFPGKLGSQTKVAHFMHKQTSLVYVNGMNQMSKDLFLLTNQYQFTILKKSLNARIIDLTTAQKTITDSYYSSGNAPQTLSIKASISKTEAIEQEIEYNTALGEVESKLKYFKIDETLNIQNLKSIDLEKYSLEMEPIFHQFEKDVESSILNSPTYLYYVEEEQKLKEQAKLEKYSIAPETEVFFSYMKRRPKDFIVDSGPLDYRIMDVTEYRGDLFSFGINMRIPVWSALNWDSVTGESEEYAKSASFSVEKSKSQMISDAERRFAILKGINKQIVLLEKQLIPQMEKAVRANLSLYGPGKATLQDSLLAKIDVLKTKIRLQDLKQRKIEITLEQLALIGKLFEHDFDNHDQTQSNNFNKNKGTN